MMTPTLHINGTSRDELLDQLSVAGGKVMDAIEALTAAAPNGRDYYPQGPSALSRAQSEHDARIARLNTVLVELTDMAEAVANS